MTVMLCLLDRVSASRCVTRLCVCDAVFCTLHTVQSYFQPVNSNDSSDLLHVFVASLCTCFVDRVHAERHNLKWETKVILSTMSWRLLGS